MNSKLNKAFALIFVLAVTLAAGSLVWINKARIAFEKPRPQVSSANASTITASPNTVSLCGGNGSSTITWIITEPGTYEIRRDTETGTLLASPQTSGQVSAIISQNTSVFLRKSVTSTSTEWRYVRGTGWTQVPVTITTWTTIASTYIQTSANCEMKVKAYPEGVSPGQPYILEMYSGGQLFSGPVDAKYRVCSLTNSSSCSSTLVATNWNNITSGQIQITTSNTLAPGSYRAAFRPSGQTQAPWSNEIEIRVGPLSNVSWSPMIRNNCRSGYIRGPSGSFIADTRIGSDCSSHNQQWLIGTTNEDANFTGGSIMDIPLNNDGVFNHAFHQKTDGTYQVGWVTDKVNFSQNLLNKYTFTGFTDNWDLNPQAPKPQLNQDVRISFRMKLMAEQAIDAGGSTGAAKNRLMLGAVARWGGRSHFVEVNLKRTDNFDLEPDANNVIDRSFGYGLPLWNEGVYFYGPRLRMAGCGSCLNLPTIEPNGSWVNFDIPISSIFKNHNWSDKPASWDNITIAGIYIGHEIWGKGRLWTEIDNYNITAR